jgi:hypothetical protein
VQVVADSVLRNPAVSETKMKESSAELFLAGGLDCVMPPLFLTRYFESGHIHVSASIKNR